MNTYSVACITLLTIGLACNTSSNTTDTGSTGSPVSAACEITESSAQYTGCGTYQTGFHGNCFGESGDHDTEGDGNGSTGGPDPCEQFDMDNAAVLTCIQQSEADGIAFSFTWDDVVNGGQFGHTTRYYVGADGTMWRNRAENEDLCTSNDTTVYGAIDLGACTEWLCIRSILDGASPVEVCIDAGCTT